MMSRAPSPTSPCRFERSVRISAPADVVFRWHEQPGALRRLTPPWERATIVEPPRSLKDGERATIAIKLGPLTMRWIAEHRDYVAGRQFRDVQIQGPFAQWSHLHRVTPDGDDACYLEEVIEYAPPLGFIGRWLGGGMIRRKLDRMFTYRHRITRDDIMAHQQTRNLTSDAADQDAQSGAALRIALSGASGLIGTALTDFLRGGQHTVLPITRSAPQSEKDPVVHWNPANGQLDPADLEGVDAIIHLAGENIAGRRWSPAKKAAIRNSRVDSTRLLAETIAKLKTPPKVFICASAMGYYGDRGDETLTEASTPGETFLARVCKEWEAAADPAREAGIRTLHTRFGIVLSAKGGPLQQMLTPFRLGLGGKVGGGRQYWSWIAIDDAVRAIHHLLINQELKGPVNLVSPNPATNREFTKALGRVINRPTVLPVPGFAAKIALGEMANELLLSSARVIPEQLQASGFEFQHPDLEEALRHLLGRR